MSSDLALAVEHLTKTFTTVGGDHRVLEDVSFVLRRGEAVGIIGPNGVGKSTLLRIVAGISHPTRGKVFRSGRVASMIELGLGFHPELTGRENVVVSATLSGIGGRSARRRVAAITEFAGLEDVIDRPVREYSTGMLARLGFAAATHIDGEILVVDEVLAVGDKEFQERCISWIGAELLKGRALLLVSHQMSLVRSTCGRAIRLDGRRVVDEGPSNEVIDRYTGRRWPLVRSLGSPVDGMQLVLDKDEISPYDAVDFSVDIEAHRATIGASLDVSLSLPLLDPDIVFARSVAPFPSIDGPGKYRLVGSTSGLPMKGGYVGVTASLLDEDGLVLGRSTADLKINGPMGMAKPLYDLRYTSELTREIEVEEGPWRRDRPRSPKICTDGVMRLNGVSKYYRSSGDSSRHRALGEVSCGFAAGQISGVIGPNGAGKSTLLRLLGGITAPSSGTVYSDGQVVPILDMGMGLHSNDDGWHHLEVISAMLGYSRHARRSTAEAVITFSGLESSAMDRHMSQWSTGMKARLGFSAAVHTPGANCFVVDELLGVGDRVFQAAAQQKMRELSDGGAAVVLVTHDMELVRSTCERAVCLVDGTIVDDGSALDVVERYSGTKAAGGFDHRTGTVQVRWLELDRRSYGHSDPLGVTVGLEVGRMADHRVEFLIRDPEVPAFEVDSMLQVAAMEVVLPAGSFSSPGFYRLSLQIEPIQGRGEAHFVVRSVDEIANEVVSERWATAIVRPLERTSSDLVGMINLEIGTVVLEKRG